MAEIELLPRNGFAGVAVPGRCGRAIGGPSPVVLAERTNVGLLQIAMRKGQTDALAETVKRITGLDLPQGPKRTSKDGFSIMGTAPGQWLAAAEGEGAGQQLDTLAADLAEIAAVADISDLKAILRIKGPAARDVLAKGCGIDLHPSVFAPGDAVRTAIALIPCQLWQLDEVPTYDLAVDASYAASFWGWITASAAEFGYEVGPAGAD